MNQSEGLFKYSTRSVTRKETGVRERSVYESGRIVGTRREPTCRLDNKIVIDDSVQTKI